MLRKHAGSISTTWGARSTSNIASNPSLPLYMQVSRGELVLHLSEHHGDGSPGIHVRIAVADVRALHAELTAKDYGYQRPRIVHQDWGEDSLTLTDPFGNRLSFFEPTP